MQVIEKHAKTVTVLTVSPDGTKIASGDAYRYQYVWDASSRELIKEFGFQKDNILSMSFSKDGTKLASTSTDLAFGIIDLTTGTTKLKKNPHEIKLVSRAIVALTGDIYTTGDDCAIRVWSGF